MPSPVTLCGSLSLYPVGLGRAMHEAGYRALGLDFAYVPFAMTEEGIPRAIDAMRALGIRGLGVSMPFKLQVMPLLDRIDPLAQAIGAVNTIVNDAGVLTGHNTDASGAVRALLEVTELAGRRAIVIGAGGAARAVVHALVSEKASVHVVNRTLDKARALAAPLGATHGALSDLAALDCDILVNCSSATMSDVDGRSPVPEDAIQKDMVVMDAVYKPIHTELVRAAERRGARAIHGGRMLLHQAAGQFELYTGKSAPLEALDEALRANLG
jgi:shikimate dehydrogenase